MTHPDDTTLQTWFDGALPEADRAAVERHVASCARCEGSVRALRALRANFGLWAEAAPGARDDLTDAIFAKLDAPADNVVPLAAAREAARERRSFSVRRVAFPALAVAAAAIIALRFGRPVDHPPRSPVGPVAQVTHPARPGEPGAEEPGGAEVTRVDVQGAQSYAVLEIPGVAPGATTAVVWIQDLDESSPATAP